MKREIVVVMAEADQTCRNECDSYEGNSGECGCSCLEFKQRTLSLDDLFKEPWFTKTLENKGFWSKEDPGEKFEYRNKYVYEYQPDGYSYSNLFKEIPASQYKPTSLKAVYQEVVGPERIKAVAQWTKKTKEYEKKQAEAKKKAADKAEEKKKLRQLKQLEKAKKLIASLEIKNVS
jgi:hypothetical protein